MTVFRRSHVRQGTTPPSNVPQKIARDLEQSAEDLRDDRIEDSAVFLRRMRSKIEAYFERKNAQTPRR